MAYDLSQLKFLLVDDNSTMLDIIRSILSVFGVRGVRTALDGETAIQMMRAFRPDVIITDYNMRPITGLEFTRWVRRSKASPNRQVGIIMTTGYSERPRVEAARDAGVSEFLVKPITPRGLYDRIVAVATSDRPFIDTPRYVGPCRRRFDDPEYPGPFRRVTDKPLRDGDEIIEIG